MQSNEKERKLGWKGWIVMKDDIESFKYNDHKYLGSKNVIHEF